MNEWIVLMEASPGHDGLRLDRRMLQQLLRAMPNALPVALHHPDRYAVQLQVTAPSPVHALSSVFTEWSEAVDGLGAPVWDVVRAEVLTRVEFERDCQVEGLGDGGNDGMQEETERTKETELADKFSS